MERWGSYEHGDEQSAPEAIERAVRTMLDHERDLPLQWATMVSITEKIGGSPQTLHEGLKKTEADSGERVGVPTKVPDKLEALERGTRELRQANEILHKASAYLG